MYEHEIIRDDRQLRLRFSIVTATYIYTPAHWHNHLEILLLLDGSMRAHIHDREYTLEEGDILVVNSREIHSTQVLQNVRYILFQIPLSDIKRLLPEFDELTVKEYFRRPASAEKDSPLEALLLEMKTLYEQRNEGYQLLFTSAYYRLLYELYTRYATRFPVQMRNRTDRNRSRMEGVLEYVRENYAMPVSLVETANSLSVSPEYFCRLFRQSTGQTFLEYVNMVRLVHFHDDLLNTDDSITSLLDKNGITNRKVLRRMFSQVYGASPQELRRAAKQSAL